MLDAFLAHSGEISLASVGISIGKRLAGDAQYDLKGTLDEVRVYDQSIDPELLAELMSAWSPKLILRAEEKQAIIYPNPTAGMLHLEGIEEDLTIYSRSGAEVRFISRETSVIDVSSLAKGIYFLKTSSGSFVEKLIID